MHCRIRNWRCGDVEGKRLASEIFNLAAPDVLDNERIFTELEKLSGKPIERQNLTVSAAMEQGIPIPFPTLFDELYSGKKFAEKFGFSYTSFEEGFLKTYNAFK